MNSEVCLTVDNAGGIVQYQVPFGEAVRRFLTKVTSKGRVSRSEYWWAQLFAIAVAYISTFLFDGSVLDKLFTLALWVVQIYLGWRRVQDTGRNGWWFVVPLYNVWILTRPSDPQENRFGSVPNTKPVEEKKAWKNGSLAVCVISAFFFVVDCCVDDDLDAEETVVTWLQSIRDNDAKTFLATTYFEAGDIDEAHEDVMLLMAEKTLKEFASEKKFNSYFKEIEIVDVLENDENTFVRFTPKDVTKKNEMLCEGVSAFQIAVVDTDDGWRVRPDQLRPVFASADQVATAKARAEVQYAKDRQNKAVEGAQAAMIKGRKLFVSIIQANTEREGAGLQNVWPQLEEDRSDDTEDIAGQIFRTSAEYFRVLFDYSNRMKGDWSPYVTGVDVDCLDLSDEQKNDAWLSARNVGWMVVCGVSDEMDGRIPVLVSGNIAASFVSFGKGKKDLARDVRVLKVGKDSGCWNPDAAWRDECVVVVRKGGQAEAIPANECTLKRIFGGMDSIELDRELRCLPIE